MFNRLIILVMLCCGPFNWLKAQTTYTWVGAAVGDYQVSSNWSPVRTTPATNDVLAFNATAPLTIANVPTQTVGAVRILSGTSSVTFTTNVVNSVLSLSAATPLVYNSAGSIIAGNLLTIALTNTGAFSLSSGTFGIAPSSGGRLTISSQLTVAGGTLDIDVAGTGGTQVNAGGSIIYQSGVFNCVNAGALNFLSGSTYNHAANGSFATAVPFALWGTGSTCLISGMNAGSIAPTGLTQAQFSNFSWNCPGQTTTVDIDLLGNTLTANGTFTLTSTGSGAVRFNSASNTNITTNNYTQTAGTIILQGGAAATVLTVRNIFSHTSSGTINFVGTGGTGTATLNLQGTVTKGSGGTIWTSGSASTLARMVIQFSGTLSQSVSAAGGWSMTAGRCDIVNINTDASGVSVTGTLRVINANSATPATCTNSGNFSGTGTIQYSGTGAGVNNFSLVYNGGAQTASAVEFPVTNAPYNLTISSTSPVSFPASFSRTVPGSLTMNSGGISVGSGNTLSLTNASLSTQLVYNGGYITSGTLSRSYPTTGLPVDASSSLSRYPFGTGANDRTVHIYFSSSSLTGGTAGDISISHAAAINATTLAPTVSDNGSVLDKRSNSGWIFNTGAFTLGSGGTTCTLTALATNIGSVDVITGLRLTDGVAGFGTLVPTGGTVDAPLLGKTALTLADFNGKTLYVGSDAINALQIVTFTWTGAVNTAWNNAGNWTGGVGFPSSPTENAVINTVGGNMPVIGAGLAVNVYQLTIASPATLTLSGTGSLSVFDLTDITGTVSFASTSTFTYASSVNSQQILDLPYGNLGIAGTAVKNFPSSTTVTGDFLVSGAAPSFPANANFTYATSTNAIQRIAAVNYQNLAISGDRGGRQIRLGNGISNNTIDVAGSFTMTATNYISSDGGFNTFNFSSTGLQTIPGFVYGNAITNSGNGPRILDPLGSTDPDHVITTRRIVYSLPTSLMTVAGSKLRINRNLAGTTFTMEGYPHHDLEVTGDFANAIFQAQNNATISISGVFSITATNYRLGTNVFFMNFNGTGAQTIPAFSSNAATNSPAWRYHHLIVTNGNRVITLGGGTDTIFIGGNFSVPSAASFSMGTGFSVAGSTVNFFNGSGSIPVLTPVSLGGNNYHHLVVNGGTRILAGDLTAGGNVMVTGTDANIGTLNIGNTTQNRTFNIHGNLTVTGTSAGSAQTSILDFNTGNRTVLINLSGNLSVSGTGLLTTNGASTVPGNLLFNGANPQYANTSVHKNGCVNFIIGNGTGSTNLSLLNNLELVRSGTQPFSSSLTVAANAVLNAGTRNITIGTDDANPSNNAVFSLLSGATLVTANTGAAPHTALEGTAVDGTSGTLLAGSTLTKNYNAGANYVLNGATVNPFPAAVTNMNNLTIGAPVSLNRAITVTGTLDLASFTLTQAGNNLQFSGLTSTTGNIHADKNAALSISGTNGTVGTLRFNSGGNTTGQFTINRPVSVPLQSALIIDHTPLTGNLITGNASSELDINGYTLTLNGAFSGPGSIGGSAASGLLLGGNAGTLRFTAGKRLLRTLTLNTAATATLGTDLEMTAGTAPGNEGVVTVNGSSVLTTAGLLTLKSGTNGTARVAAGSAAGGYISGDVTVERYLAAVRAWRFLAAPTVGQTIKQAWQENQPAGVNPGTGYGTNITSNSGNWLADGFDFYSPGNSLLSYNAALNGWQGVTGTNIPIASAGSNNAYMLFSRGDRSITPAPGASPTPVLLRSKGALFQGTLPAITIPVAGQFAAVGNNYAAPIDFTGLTRTNLAQSFSVWDPKLPGAQGVGAWVTFSASTVPAWIPVPGGGSYTAGVPNTRIESGQAFIISAASAGGSLTFTESSKTTGSRLVARPLDAGTAAGSLITNLYLLSGGEARIADGNVAVFSDAYANAVDEHDALKPNNFSDNFAISQGGKSLAVNARSGITEADTLFYEIKRIRQQSYRLECIFSGMDASLTAFLEDTYLRSLTPLSMNGSSTVDFSVNADAASAAPGRFRIVFRQAQTLPLSFVRIAARQRTGGNEVEWEVEEESGITQYEVERSSDGQQFARAGVVMAGGMGSYNWLDAYPAAGDQFYRVKALNSRGTWIYSRIVKVSAAKSITGYTVYPNPVTDGQISLKMGNQPAGMYQLVLSNQAGQILSRQQLMHAGGTATIQLKPLQVQASGNCQLEITQPDGKKSVVKILLL